MLRSELTEIGDTNARLGDETSTGEMEGNLRVEQGTSQKSSLSKPEILD